MQIENRGIIALYEHGGATGGDRTDADLGELGNDFIETVRRMGYRLVDQS